MTRPRTGPDSPYTTGDVAKLFRVDQKTVARWADAGKLGCFHTLGGHRRFHPEEVMELLNKTRKPAL